MLTEKDYCDYETCVALKELGIGWENVPEKWAKRYFFTRITLYDAQKWLREEKRICVEVDCCASGYTWELCKAYQGDWFSGGNNNLHSLLRRQL